MMVIFFFVVQQIIKYHKQVSFFINHSRLAKWVSLFFSGNPIFSLADTDKQIPLYVINNIQVYNYIFTHLKIGLTGIFVYVL